MGSCKITLQQANCNPNIIPSVEGPSVSGRSAFVDVISSDVSNDVDSHQCSQSSGHLDSNAQGASADPVVEPLISRTCHVINMASDYCWGQLHTLSVNSRGQNVEKLIKWDLMEEKQCALTIILM